jgi:nucleoid-associated protein YgaU
MALGAVVILIVGLLVVNYFRGLDTGTTLPSVSTEDLLSVELPTTHTVEAGDDLWKISERYYKSGYNWVDIASENNLQAPYTIETGQELAIPDVEARILDQEKSIDDEVALEDIKEEPQETDGVISEDLEVKDIEALTDTKTDTTESISDATYTVVKGDTLWDISVRAYGDGYRWVDIASENDLVNPNLIHAGNVFVLPR